MQQLILPYGSQSDNLDCFGNIKVNDYIRVKPKYLNILAVSDLHLEIIKYLMAGHKNRFKVLKIVGRKEAVMNPLIYVYQLLLVEHYLYYSSVELIEGSRTIKILNSR